MINTLTRNFTSVVLMLFLGAAISHTEVFSSLNLVIKSGVSFPQREIAKTLVKAPFGGILLKTPYYGNFNTHLALGYHPLRNKHANKYAQLFKMALGLEYDAPNNWIPFFGLELGSYVMAVKYGKDTYVFESEFGSSPFVYFTIPIKNSLELHIGCDYDIVFTAPNEIYIFNANIGVEWSLW